MKKNQGEKLKKLLAKHNTIQTEELLLIPTEDGEDLVLETIIINKKLRITIVSDTKEAVIT